MANKQPPSEYEQDIKSLDSLKNLQQNEANLNWTRNSYFLVVLTLLTLAYSQKPVDNAIQLTLYQVSIASTGIALSIIWFKIQQRSSHYIAYYKKEANRLSIKTNTPEFYPRDLKGTEMRKLVHYLPVAFIILSIIFVIFQLYFLAYPLPVTPSPSSTPTPLTTITPTPS